MELLSGNGLDFVKATLVVTSDFPAKTVDAGFFHGRSFGDEVGLIPLAGELYSTGLIRRVVLPNNEGERCGADLPFVANPGKTAYRQMFRGAGIPDSDIVDSILRSCHTREESEGFIHLAQLEGWTSAVILTQPHQLLRAMLGTLKVMQLKGWGMEIYSATPRSVDWSEEVFGSQGMQRKSRWQHIADELERILNYTQKGDLATLNELFSYINNRNSIARLRDNDGNS